MAKAKDLTGLRFGQLTVLSLDEDFEKIRAGRQKRWICRCDCGVEKSIIGAELTRKNKSQKSCGCLSKQRQKHFGDITKRDLTNIKIGLLIPQYVIGTNSHGYQLWLCQCDCGLKKIASSRELLSKETLSCGCKRGHYWEDYVADCLKEKGISFQREYSFKDLRDVLPLRFDFAIFKENRLLGLIEFQGSQHFDKNNIYYNSNITKHDNQKRDYCEQYNLPLCEILFNQVDNIQQILDTFLEGIGALSD